MTRDTVTALPAPSGFSADPLTDFIRSGARQLIERALEAELGAPSQCRKAAHPKRLWHAPQLLDMSRKVDPLDYDMPDADADDIIWMRKTTQQNCLGFQTPVETLAQKLCVAIKM